MPFEFKPLEIPDLILVESRAFHDARGHFYEHYKQSEFAANGITDSFPQDNYSLSKKNVIRGLHYQIPPEPQAKLVRVISGVIWDVAVDIRKSSPHYLQWIGVELSGENRSMLYIPPGFAHGFVALSDDVHLMYKCSTEYSPTYERGISYNDPKINISWPVSNPIISQRDQELPLLADADLYD